MHFPGIKLGIGSSEARSNVMDARVSIPLYGIPGLPHKFLMIGRKSCNLNTFNWAINVRV